MFRPMLAAKEPKFLRFPCVISPKIDGIRCLILNGKAVSRNLKPIPNAFVQKVLANAPEGLDGELCVGPPTLPNLMQETVSGVMSYDGEPDFTYQVFDNFLEPSLPFLDRFAKYVGVLQETEHIRCLQQKVVFTKEDLEKHVSQWLELGYEGAMIRSPAGPYKYGRSTANENYLVKIKHFDRDEARVVGFQPLLKNENAATTNLLGLTERSSHAENKKELPLLGALICENHLGRFQIGTGFKMYEREKLWKERETLLGQYVTYKSFKQTGVKQAPRFPVFVSFRPDLDLPPRNR